MQQPWIHKAGTDGVFILAPSFVVVAVVLLCHQQLASLESQYSFYTWLFLIVFIDVAHVYATLFKTYFNPAEFQRRKRQLIVLPLLCLGIGMLLFALGAAVFWRVLAYVAVFHFIRQQYGFMRLYSRHESKTKWNMLADNLVIYTATGYPMLFWFLSPQRNFNWFTPGDFIRWESGSLLTVLQVLYVVVMAFYVLRTLQIYWKQRYFNIPKNAIVVGTALSWYFGIVHYNNDLVFTLLNVVSHGIPYMALVYLREFKTGSTGGGTRLVFWATARGAAVYVAVLLVLAFSEEYLWEILVWNEHFPMAAAGVAHWSFLLVPLLTVPQFTHYLLDGIIWKRPQ